MSGWNQIHTDAIPGMTCETVTVTGHGGKAINAYAARPVGAGPFGGMVFTHHMPGWDEWTRETVRRLAEHGYNVICPNLFFDAGHGTPEDVAAKIRGEGGAADATVVADLEAGMKWLKALPNSNGKVGIMGPCSGGRHTFLTVCSVTGFDAAVELWGGSVVMSPDQLNEKRPVAPIGLTRDLCCPLLGIFGNDDQGPTPEQVNEHEEELKKHGKDYEFHRYDGAGHGIFYYDRPMYRQQQAMDGWNKVLAFLEKHLQE